MFLRRLKQINFQLASWVPLPPHTNSIIINGFCFRFIFSFFLSSVPFNALCCEQHVDMRPTSAHYEFICLLFGIAVRTLRLHVHHTMAMLTRKTMHSSIRRNNRSVLCEWSRRVVDAGYAPLSHTWAVSSRHDLQLQSMAFDPMIDASRCSPNRKAHNRFTRAVK